MFNDTPLWLVDDEESLAKCAERLAAAPVIGVDTESDSFHHYQEKVCLIQFSDLEIDYIVDPLAVPDLSILGPIFANPDIVKIFHGADYDVVCMRRDFDFTITNIFDTMVASQMLGLPRVGLADLIGNAFGHKIDKQYQRHDWAKRPLFDEHIDYARGDTHFLLALREILMRKLKTAGKLDHVAEECAILEKREWARRTFNEDGYIGVKGAKRLDDTGMRILRRLYLHRNEVAKRLDRPQFKVLSDGVLVDVAEARPIDRDALDDLFPRKIPMKRRHGDAVVQAVIDGLEDDFDIPKPKKVARKGPVPKISGRLADRAFLHLKNWRNAIIDADKKLSPVTVASNTILKNIVGQRPTTLDELRAVKDVRNWQVKDFGAEILRQLDELLPLDEDGKLIMPETDPSAPSKRRRRRRRGGRENEAE